MAEFNAHDPRWAPFYEMLDDGLPESVVRAQLEMHNYPGDYIHFIKSTAHTRKNAQYANEGVPYTSVLFFFFF